MNSINESEQVLELTETTGKEFQITGSALVSLEGIVAMLATAAGLTAAITLSAFDGARLLTFVITGADAGGGSIAIAGTDAEGNSQTETLTFTGASGTMTTSNAYISAGLTATPATFTQGTVTVTGSVSGDWVVQYSRKNANPRVWNNEFEPGQALTAKCPTADIKGSPSRIYRVTGGNTGVTGWLDYTYILVYR